jgi:DNA-binding transcriptional MerR regulator
MNVMERTSSSFNPNSYSDVPLYNIQAVAGATGVPAITLRSWERRYGVPQPKRDPKGYRLYSERDIALTKWLRDRVEHGVGISRAVNMLHVLEQEQPQPAEQRTLDLRDQRQRMMEAIRRLDENMVNRVVAEGLMVASVEQVCLHLLQPVLYEIGEMWASGRLSVTTEHVASNLIRLHIAQLVRISAVPLRQEQIIVGCAPGEQHDIGALILTLFLRRRGYDVIYAGASVEPTDFIADVLRVSPAAVCLSAGSPKTAQTLATIFKDLERQFGGPLFFGGRAFNEHPGLCQKVPGTYLGPDAAEAVRHIEATIGGLVTSVAPFPA